MSQEKYEDSNQFVLVDEQMYEVESLLKKRVMNGVTQYLVKWRGWDDAGDSTWEPVDNLKNVKDLINEFQARINEKSKKKERSEQQQVVAMEIEEKEPKKRKLKKESQKQREQKQKVQRSPNKKKSRNQIQIESSQEIKIVPTSKEKSKSKLKRRNMSQSSNSSRSKSSKKKEGSKKIASASKENKENSKSKLKRRNMSQSSNSKSSKSSKKREESKNKPVLTIGRVNGMLVKPNNEIFYEVNIVNSKKQCIGVQLRSSQELKKKRNQQQLLSFLERFLQDELRNKQQLMRP